MSFRVLMGLSEADIQVRRAAADEQVLLAKEKGRWPLTRLEDPRGSFKKIPGDGGAVKVYEYRRGEREVDEYENELDLANCWGWLTPEGMGSEGDSWWLGFTPLGRGRREWGQDGLLNGVAVLPTVWNGKLWARRFQADEDKGLVVGYFDLLGQGRRFWTTPYQGGEMPKIPKLGKGAEGEGLGEELILLGVLRRYRHMKSELMVAWGDNEGRLLGWEWVAGMGEVRNMKGNEVRRLGVLPGWEEVEVGLRMDGYGKGL